MRKIVCLLIFVSLLFTNAFSQNGQWTWVGGDNAINQPVVYSTKGIASSTNTPGGREGSVSWTDAGVTFGSLAALALPAMAAGSVTFGSTTLLQTNGHGSPAIIP
jgi:hypothetical protein